MVKPNKPEPKHSLSIRIPEHINKKIQTYVDSQPNSISLNTAILQLIEKGLTQNQLNQISDINRELQVIAIALEGISKQNTNIIESNSDIIDAIMHQTPEINQFKADNNQQKG